jgi:hypothetical protein
MLVVSFAVFASSAELESHGSDSAGIQHKPLILECGKR